MNSRDKGARGERQWADVLREHGFDARRGQQFSGIEGEDVVSNLPIHWEVKRVERLNVQAAVDQAVRDAAPDKLPAVAHRRNRCEWNVTMRAADFFILLGVDLDELPDRVSVMLGRRT